MKLEEFEKANKIQNHIMIINELFAEAKLNDVFIVCGGRKYLVTEKSRGDVLNLLQEKKESLEKEFAEL